MLSTKKLIFKQHTHIHLHIWFAELKRRLLLQQHCISSKSVICLLIDSMVLSPQFSNVHQVSIVNGFGFCFFCFRKFFYVVRNMIDFSRSAQWVAIQFLSEDGHAIKDKQAMKNNCRKTTDRSMIPWQC